ITGTITSLTGGSPPTGYCADFGPAGNLCVSLPPGLAGNVVAPPYAIGDPVRAFPLFPLTRPTRWMDDGAGRSLCSALTDCGGDECDPVPGEPGNGPGDGDG